MEEQSLEHTRWNCKYHIVFAPKFRRKIVYGKYRKEIGLILRKLCEYKRIEILEANACVDHIHMCIKIPPKYSVSQIMGYLKGKSSLMIFEQFSKGYFVSTVVVNEVTIIRYIREQEMRDKIADQHSLIKHKNPFMGSWEQWQKSGHACFSGQTRTGPL